VAEIFNTLPGELRLSAAKVSSPGSKFVDRSLELKLLDDHARSEVEVSVDDALEVFISES
jgi:hypothetical protein